MANLEIKIDAAEPFAEGRAFGEAGPYLRIRGTAKGIGRICRCHPWNEGGFDPP